MNQVRFHVYDGENLIHTSDWADESTRVDAGNALAEVRQRMGGNFAYRIERTGDSKTPNHVPMTRFKIKVGESLLYSKILNETERESALKDIKDKFPNAEIEELKWRQ